MGDEHPTSIPLEEQSHFEAVCQQEIWMQDGPLIKDVRSQMTWDQSKVFEMRIAEWA